MAQTSTATAPDRRRRWRLPKGPLIVALIAVAGMCLAMYPSVAAYFAQVQQSKVIANSVTAVDGNKAEADAQLQLARQYNEMLSAGAVLEANNRLPTGVGTAESGMPDYDSLLNDGVTGVMSRLRIPKIDLDLPIYHGTSDATLLKGLGHLEGTSLPVGGLRSHSVITGHRGLAEATMFTNLDKVEVGDRFTLTTFGEVLTYQVIETKVVDPDQTESLRAVEGKDLVTLVTCTPLGINSQRILVTGERVSPTPQADIEAAGRLPDIPGFPWWAVIVGGGLIVAGGYVWRSGYSKHGRPAKSD